MMQKKLISANFQKFHLTIITENDVSSDGNINVCISDCV